MIDIRYLPMRFRFRRHTSGIFLACSAFLFTISPACYADVNSQSADSIVTEIGIDDLFNFGILWRIDSDHRDPSFLFGTMHVEDPRVTALAPPVQAAFDQSSSLTTEALLDLEHILQIGPKLLLTNGETLPELIGSQLYDQVKNALRSHGMIPDMAALLKPWAVALLLSQPTPRTGEFLDRKLYLRARKSGKAVYGLETMTEQISIFDTMSLRDQVILLEETLAEAHMAEELIDELTRAYLARDLARLNDLANEQFTSSALQQRLKRQLLLDRNSKMVNRMIDRLEEGNAFIAIGALHLPGPTGVLNLLRERGYRISRVY